MKTWHLKFNKEEDGCWYIDYPSYPFAHHNLMMVAGADMLCEYVADKQNSKDTAVIDVTINDNLIDNKEPDIRMDRFKRGYGASYTNTTKEGTVPEFELNGRKRIIPESWICPVTLFVLGRYPKRINAYIK